MKLHSWHGDWHSSSKMSKFFRFLSRRRTGRGVKSDHTDHGGHPVRRKNVVQCTVMLLDGTDFTTEIHVSRPICIEIDDLPVLGLYVLKWSLRSIFCQHTCRFSYMCGEWQPLFVNQCMFERSIFPIFVIICSFMQVCLDIYLRPLRLETLVFWLHCVQYLNGICNFFLLELVNELQWSESLTIKMTCSFFFYFVVHAYTDGVNVVYYVNFFVERQWWTFFLLELYRLGKSCKYITC